MVVVGEIVATITTIITVIKAMRSTYRWGKEVLLSKWQNELIKYQKYLRGVKREVTAYKNSKCSDTILALLDGEVKEGSSILAKWDKIPRPWKRVRSPNFIKKLKRSKANIDQTLQLLRDAQNSKTAKRTAHTSRTAKRTTKHTNISVKIIVINGNVNLNHTAAQPCNGHQLRMENGNRNRLLMEKGNQSPLESGKVHRPTRHEKVDKGHKSQLRMGKENDEHRPPMEKANQSPMERGKVHGPTTKKKVEKKNDGKPQRIKERKEQ